MRFLFATDLHGDKSRYLYLTDVAPELGASAIVVGGDISPKFGDPFEDQPKFYRWMRGWADDQLIPIHTYLGNDDLACFLTVFFAQCRKSRNLHALGSAGVLEGFTYERYNYITDSPFGLKDWSRLDYDGWVSPPQLSDHVVVSECVRQKKQDVFRYRALPDLAKFLKSMPTIQQDLKFASHRAEILFAHCPPADLSLDICYGGDRPGSRAILEWIDDIQPAVTLHGHIHESYQITGIWRVTRGATEVIQPGSRHFVVVDLERDELGEIEVHTKLMPYK